jgi:hypothetical protein
MMTKAPTRCRHSRRSTIWAASAGSIENFGNSKSVQGGSFWKRAKWQDLLPNDLITAGAHQVLHKQQAVTPDSMLAIIGDNADPEGPTAPCSLPAASRIILTATVPRFLEVAVISGSLQVDQNESDKCV